MNGNQMGQEAGRGINFSLHPGAILEDFRQVDRPTEELRDFLLSSCPIPDGDKAVISGSLSNVELLTLYRRQHVAAPHAGNLALTPQFRIY